MRNRTLPRLTGAPFVTPQMTDTLRLGSHPPSKSNHYDRSAGREGERYQALVSGTNPILWPQAIFFSLRELPLPWTGGSGHPIRRKSLWEGAMLIRRSRGGRAGSGSRDPLGSAHGCRSSSSSRSCDSGAPSFLRPTEGLPGAAHNLSRLANNLSALRQTFPGLPTTFLGRGRPFPSRARPFPARGQPSRPGNNLSRSMNNLPASRQTFPDSRQPFPAADKPFPVREQPFPSQNKVVRNRARCRREPKGLSGQPTNLFPAPKRLCPQEKSSLPMPKRRGPSPRTRPPTFPTPPGGPSNLFAYS